MKRNPDKLIRKFLGIGSDNLMGQEPTYLGFAIKFDFENIRDKADINHIIPGLLLDDDDLDSSINYLRRTGQELKSNYLVEFIKQLKDIQDNKPWYFQSISGLEEIWKRPDSPENTVMFHDLVLTVECLESLDLQMTFLAMLYKKAKSDKWQRTLLPMEKRQFHARIIVCEIRNLNKVKEKIEQADAIVSDIGKESPSSFLGNIDSATTAANKFSGGLIGNSDLAQTYAQNKMLELDSNGAVGVNTGDTSSMSTVDWQYLENKYGQSNKLMIDPSKAFSNLGGDVYDGITSYGQEEEDNTISPKFNAFERGGQENYASLDNKYNSLVDLLESLDDYISVLVYDLYNCEFDFNSLPYTENVSASTFPESAKFKFDINVGNATMIGKFGFFKWIVSGNMDKAAAPPDFVSKEPFDQQDYEKMASSYSRDGFFTMNDRRVAEDKEIGTDSAVDDTFTAKAARFGGRFGKNQLDKMRGKVNGVVGDMTRESIDYLKNIEDIYNSKRMQVTNTVKSLYDSIDLSNPESILDAYRKTKDELYGTTNGEFGKADENAIGNAIVNSGLGNAYDLNSDSITTKMTAERDLNYRLLRKFKDSETGEDRFSKNIGDTGTNPQDAPQDLKFGKLRINENGVGIPNVGLDAPSIRTDINKIDFSSNGHLTVVEPSNVGLNGATPNNYINNITLEGAEPSTGITPDPLEGAEPSTGITPDPLEGAEPSTGITPDPLTGAKPMVGITPDPLTGAKPMEGPLPITLEGTPPMVGITPDPLTGAKPMEGPLPITLEGTPPMVGITPDKLEGAQPMTDITPDKLEGAKPNSIITPDKLEGAKPNSTITPDKLEGAKPNSTITPIKFEGIKTDNKITPIKFEGIKTDNKITKIELTGVGKNDSKNIGKVDMETKTSNMAITPIKLEGVSTKDVNTIGKIDFDLVKNDSKIEKIDLVAPNIIKDITPIKLEGATPDNKITPIELTASKALGSSDITDIKLEGSESNTKITKITLESPAVKTEITPIKFENVDVKTEITPIELKGVESTTTITNIKLEGQKSNTKITNSELTGVSPKDTSTLGNIGFENKSTKTQISKNELTGSTPNIKITQSKLVGSNSNSKITEISFDSAGKKGSDEIGSFKLEGKKSNTSISELTFNDIKKNDKKLDNINLVGADKKNLITEIKLEGSKPETKITQISFNGNVSNNSINGIELKGTTPLTGKNINNIELTGITKNETISIHKVFDNKPDSNITISNSNILENDTVKNDKKVTQDKLEGATTKQTTPNNINDKEVNIDKNISTENIGYTETPHLTDISNKNIYGSNIQTTSSKIIQDPLSGATPVSRITQDPLEGSKPSTNIIQDPLSGATPVSRITQDPLEGAKPSTNIIQDPLSGAKPSTNIIQDPLSGATPVSRITQDPLEGAKPNNKISQDY